MRFCALLRRFFPDFVIYHFIRSANPVFAAVDGNTVYFEVVFLYEITPD